MGKFTWQQVNMEEQEFHIKYSMHHLQNKNKVTLFSKTQQSLIIYLVGRLSVASTTISYLRLF